MYKDEAGSNAEKEWKNYLQYGKAKKKKKRQKKSNLSHRSIGEQPISGDSDAQIQQFTLALLSVDDPHINQ